MSEKTSENSGGRKGSFSFFKSVFFAVLALLIAVGTFFLERELSPLKESFTPEGAYIAVEGRNEVEVQHAGSKLWDRFADKYVLAESETIRTNDSDAAVIHFPKGALIKLDRNTELSFSTDGAASEVNLKKGRVWLNTLYSADNCDVTAVGVKISPFNSVSDINFIDEKVSAYAHKGHIRVSFYENDEFLNSLLVTEGNKIDVNVAKLQSKLSKVLYSKLIKEFHYRKLSDADKGADMFISENVSRDKIYFGGLISQKIQELRERPLYNVSLDSFAYSLKSSINSANAYLVFDDDKKASRLLNFFLRHLYDAEHLFADFDFDEADSRLSFFEELISSYDFSGNDKARILVSDALLSEFKTLSFAGPGGDLYPLRDFIRSAYLDFTISGAPDIFQHFYVIRTYLNDAASVIDSDVYLARNLVDQYKRRLEEASSSYSLDLGLFKNVFIEENQIFDNLLLRSDVLYKDKYFAYKSFLEKQWLSLLSDKSSLDEEKRVMVSKKIIFLKKLREYFLSEKLAVDDAKSILYRLLDEIEKYRSGMPGAAVDEMFAENLSDLGSFWDFLNDPEYSVSFVHGTSRKDRYDVFLGIKPAEGGIADLKKKILGEIPTKVQEGTTYDAEKEVLDAFHAVSVDDLSVSGLNSYSQRFVTVSGIAADLKFSCTYDREDQFLSNIFINDEVLTSGVKLEKLPILVETYLSKGGFGKDSGPNDGSAAEVSVETKEEKIAKIILTEKLAEFNIEVDKDNVAVVDLDGGVFRVNHKITAGSSEIAFSFELNSVSNVVSKIKLYFPDFEKELLDEVPLSDLLKFVGDSAASPEDSISTISSEQPEKDTLKSLEEISNDML